MWILIWRELRDYFIDLLRVVQYILIAICFWYDVVSSTLLIFYPDVNSLLIDIVFDVIASLFLYYIINQLSWFILIKHLNTYAKMRRGSKFEDCRKQIRVVEFRSTIFAVLFQIIFISSIVWIDTVFQYNKLDIVLKNSILYGIYALISFILAISEFLLFKQLQLHKMK